MKDLDARLVAHARQEAERLESQVSDIRIQIGNLYLRKLELEAALKTASSAKSRAERFALMATRHCPQCYVHTEQLFHLVPDDHNDAHLSCMDCGVVFS